MVINGRRLLWVSPIVGMIAGKDYAFGVSHGLGEAGYDVRIKQNITFTRDLFMRRCIVVEDEKLDTLSRHPGKFTIASTIEEFKMPDDLMGIVHDKSTWARRGLSVFNTVIESGWSGHLTLELVYHGWKDLHIPAGSGIAQVIFHQLAIPSRYTGRYQNQADEPVPAISALDRYEADRQGDLVL